MIGSALSPTTAITPGAEPGRQGALAAPCAVSAALSIALVAMAAGVACRGDGPRPARHDAPPTASPAVDAATVDAPTRRALVLDASVEATAADAPAVAPAETPSDWVDVAVHVPTVVLDLRYATDRNLTGAPLYPIARCLLRRAVAARLAAAARDLAARGHRLLLWDCYRPATLQVELWRRVPDPRFVARPRFDEAGRPLAGSRHSRGAAVDVSLADPGGAPRPMPTDHDDFTAAAAGTRATGPAARHLADLRAAMTAAGFVTLPSEWWHFDAPDAHAYPLADDPLVGDLVRDSPR